MSTLENNTAQAPTSIESIYQANILSVNLDLNKVKFCLKQSLAGIDNNLLSSEESSFNDCISTYQKLQDLYSKDLFKTDL
jgi:hypothetical protein